jgi:NAD(P)H-quinone oxidoreductase subunit 5
MSSLLLFEILAALIFMPTVGVFVWLAASMLLSKKPMEATVVRFCRIAIGSAFLSALAMAVLLPIGSANEIVLGSWFSAGHYSYEIVMQTDIIAVVYALFTTLLLYVICSFSKRYLHKESGFHRFYLIMLLFALGLLLVSFSGTVELLLVGWEIVGLSSVLLIAFFTRRDQPARNGLWVFSVYRLTDIGLYAAVLYLHLTATGTRFEALNSASWAGIPAHEGAEITALLLILAVIGKSALFPLSNWLPRAMEGPTPSSAVFYGALSVNLGPLLLLRMGDVIANSPLIGWLLIAIGLATVLVGNLAGRVQSDIKSRLAYGSITQLGFIVIEIAFGWVELALVHVVAHAVIRTLQLLRAPSLLHERHHLEQMLGHHIRVFHPSDETVTNFQRFMFRLRLERCFLDNLLVDWLVNKTLLLIRLLDKLECRLAELITGHKGNVAVPPAAIVDRESSSAVIRT